MSFADISLAKGDQVIDLAAAALGQGQMHRAATLFGTAEALRETIDVTPPPFIRDDYDRSVADLRAALGEEEFTKAWDQGRSMSFEQAISSALATAPV